MSAVNAPHFVADPVPIRIASRPPPLAAAGVAGAGAGVRELVRVAAPALDDLIAANLTMTAPTELQVPLDTTTGMRVDALSLVSLSASDPVPLSRTRIFAVPLTPDGPILADQDPT